MQRPQERDSPHLICDIWPLRLAEQRDGRVCLRREDVHQRIAVPVQCHAGTGLEQLSIERGQDPDIVVGACCGADNARVGVHHLQELTDDQRHGLNALDFLLGAQQLALQAALLLLDVVLLQQVSEQSLLRVLCAIAVAGKSPLERGCEE